MTSLFFKRDIAHCFGSVNGYIYMIRYGDDSILRKVTDETYSMSWKKTKMLYDMLNFQVLYHAGLHNRFDIVCLIIGRLENSVDLSRCMDGACRAGNIDLAEFIIRFSRIIERYIVETHHIFTACLAGHARFLTMLLEEFSGVLSNRITCSEIHKLWCTQPECTGIIVKRGFDRQYLIEYATSVRDNEFRTWLEDL